jgi:hypothetical protein
MKGNEILLFADNWMELENIILSKKEFDVPTPEELIQKL